MNKKMIYIGLYVLLFSCRATKFDCYNPGVAKFINQDTFQLTNMIQLGIYYLNLKIVKEGDIVKGETGFYLFGVNGTDGVSNNLVFEVQPEVYIFSCRKSINCEVIVSDTLALSDKMGKFSFKVENLYKNDYLILKEKYRDDNIGVIKIKNIVFNQ